MITHLLQSALILTLFYSAYKILFERFTFFQHNRFFLLCGLGLSILLPFLPLNFSQERTEYIYLSRSYFENVPPASADETIPALYWQDWGLSNWILAVYLFGVFVFGLIMLLQIIQVSLLISKGKLIHKDGMKLVLTDKTTSPFSFFNAIVMNPEMLSEEQLGHIVTHENIHISQWHQLDVVMAEILKIILWFFPVSWWYGKSIRTNLEFIADTNSLENGLDKKAYQLNLVSISQQPSGSVLVNNFSKKLIKNRIKMLNKMKTRKQILSFYALLIPALLLISIGISVQAQSQNEKVKQVIVLSEEKIDPQDLRIQIKNENGEFENLDSANLKLVETTKFPGGSAVVMKSDGTLHEMENKVFDWQQLVDINSENIATVDVHKEGKKDKIIIVYKNDQKSDTIVIPDNGVYAQAYTFKDFDQIFSPKELKMKIQKGEFDLNKPENRWMKQWKKDNFKEPVDYHGYYKLLENWDGDVYKTRKIEIIPNPDAIYRTFKMDSLALKNYPDLPKGYSAVYPQDFKIYKRENLKFTPVVKEFKFLDNIGNKKPLVIIDGKISTLKKLRKLEGNKEYQIFYMESEAMIKKHGKKAKDGVIIAKKRNETLEEILGIK